MLVRVIITFAAMLMSVSMSLDIFGDVSDLQRIVATAFWFAGYGVLEAGLGLHKRKVINTTLINSINNQKSIKLGEIHCVCGHINEYYIDRIVIESWLYGWVVELDGMFKGKSLTDDAVCSDCGRTFAVNYNFKVTLLKDDSRGSIEHDE